MKTLFHLVIFLFFWNSPLFSQLSVFELKISEAQLLEKIPNEKASLQKYQEALMLESFNIQALYKSAELCCRIGAREEQTKSRDFYFGLALNYASAAVKYFPQNDEANVAMSMTLGRMALTKNGKEKIKLVKQIKDYADRAIHLNPNNFKAWHILGKWNYEVANLNMIEQAAIEVFYGGLPDASYKKAVQAYEKAKSLSPYFSLNYLELAKAYHKTNQNIKGLELLRYLLNLPITTEDDQRIKSEARKLIQEWD